MFWVIAITSLMLSFVMTPWTDRFDRQLAWTSNYIFLISLAHFLLSKQLLSTYEKWSGASISLEAKCEPPQHVHQISGQINVPRAWPAWCLPLMAIRAAEGRNGPSAATVHHMSPENKCEINSDFRETEPSSSAERVRPRGAWHVMGTRPT